jgi:hypothetical protein
MSNLVSYALVTLNEVQEALQISAGPDDARLNGYINRATDMIEQYCQRRFLSTAYTNELYSGDNTYYLYTRNWPITALSALSWGSGSVGSRSFEAVDTSNYAIETQGAKDRGAIYSEVGFPNGSDNIRISYTAGYTQANIPGYIKEACLELVSYLYGRSKATPGMKSETLGRYSYTVESPTQGKDGLIERLGLDAILDQHRSIPI